jgi:hypothetical protein
MAFSDVENIYNYVQYQYVNYQKFLEADVLDDKEYIEGKRDAYREMQHYLEIYLYSSNPSP